MYRQSEKNLLSSNTSSTCPDNMVNFGLLTAEICWRVWGTPTNFNGFCVLQRYCTVSSSGRQPNFAALNRGRHLCSAGRPSGWALAHILVLIIDYTDHAECTHCQQPLSVKHILTECISCNQTLQQCYVHTNLKDIFYRSPIENILNFI